MFSKLLFKKKIWTATIFMVHTANDYRKWPDVNNARVIKEEQHFNEYLRISNLQSYS